MGEGPALLPHHWEQLTQGSGIAPEVIAERGYRSIAGLGTSPSSNSMGLLAHNGPARPQAFFCRYGPLTGATA